MADKVRVVPQEIEFFDPFSSDRQITVDCKRIVPGHKTPSSKDRVTVVLAAVPNGVATPTKASSFWTDPQTKPAPDQCRRVSIPVKYRRMAAPESHLMTAVPMFMATELAPLADAQPIEINDPPCASGSTDGSSCFGGSSAFTTTTGTTGAGTTTGTTMDTSGSLSGSDMITANQPDASSSESSSSSSDESEEGHVVTHPHQHHKDHHNHHHHHKDKKHKK